ncbi:MAG: type II toxin-antitoxin system HicA family toxin [Planctomycetota bacterium]|nr:type II toxin-antitoxin system HicA family toxin [Planctomycetota bacterium]
MASLPSVTGAEAIRAFQKLGFEVVRTKGSHHILKKQEHRDLLTVPVHGNDPLKNGLLRSLIRGAGIDVETFVSLL